VFSSDEQKLASFANTEANTLVTRDIALSGSPAVLVVIDKNTCSYELFSEYG